MTNKSTNRIANLILAIGIAGLIYGIIGLIRVLLSPDYELIRTKLV